MFAENRFIQMQSAVIFKNSFCFKCSHISSFLQNLTFSRIFLIFISNLLQVARHFLPACHAGAAQRVGGLRLFAAIFLARPSTLDARPAWYCHKKAQNSREDSRNLTLLNEGSTICILKTRYLEGMFFQQAFGCFYCNMPCNLFFSQMDSRMAIAH